jgi:hypothetical protein
MGQSIGSHLMNSLDSPDDYSKHFDNNLGELVGFFLVNGRSLRKQLSNGKITFRLVFFFVVQVSTFEKYGVD